jgi:hypothetical protein
MERSKTVDDPNQLIAKKPPKKVQFKSVEEEDIIDVVNEALISDEQSPKDNSFT